MLLEILGIIALTKIGNSICKCANEFEKLTDEDCEELEDCFCENCPMRK